MFVVLDVVAIVCAVIAVRRRERRMAGRALLVSGLAAGGCFGTMQATVAVGLSSAFGASGTGADPSQAAQELAGGISVAMNGAAFGLLATLIAGLATLVCMMALSRAKSRSPGVAAQTPVP